MIIVLVLAALVGGLLGPAAAVPKPASDLELQADILALKHVSRIFGQKLLMCQTVRFVGMASPPVQCSNTGLKMRKQNCLAFEMSENPTELL